MQIMLLIIGTSHTFQCATVGTDDSKVAAFEAELRRVCEKYRVRRIAEEMSKAGLAHQAVEYTVGGRIAKDLRIEHHNVDLEPEERANLSLDDGPMLNIVCHHHFPDGGGTFRNAFNSLGDGVRERCWVGRMLARKEWPTLFVCGANHADSVKPFGLHWVCL
jgi:hypothetical protein